VVTSGESKEESRVEGPESRAEASGVLPSSFALRGNCWRPTIFIASKFYARHFKKGIQN
jgi:hypothetical protein